MKAIIRITMLVSCLWLTGTSILKAQLKGGVEGAITTSSVKITDIPGQFTNSIQGDNIMGFEAGLFLVAGMGPLYVKPKFLLDYQGGTVYYHPSATENTELSASYRAGKILVPVLVGFKLIPVLSLEAGPVYNHILFVTNNMNGNELDVVKGGLGYRIGINAAVSMLNFTISYQGIKNSGATTSRATYQNPDQVIFGLGIAF